MLTEHYEALELSNAHAFSGVVSTTLVSNAYVALLHHTVIDHLHAHRTILTCVPCRTLRIFHRPFPGKYGPQAQVGEGEGEW
jgi:hypothetical protein